MRPMHLLLAAATVLALTGCSFEEPPPSASDAANTPARIPGPPDVDDPCTAYALTLLDGLLNGLPSADEQTSAKAASVADAFQARYDEVIAADGVEAARARYSDEVAVACAA